MMSSGEKRLGAAPPRPRLCFRVGVTGHRGGSKLPKTEIERIRAQVGAVLAQVSAAVANVHDRYRSAFSAEAPLLTAVSALAEGGDRIVAEEALTAEWHLDAVLPFGRDQYERDFEAPESRADFRSILSRARAVLELEARCDTGDRSLAYETAGLVMLDQSDLLIAIWDGSEGEGRGGTREIVEQASRRGLPVVWISSTVDQPPTCLRDVGIEAIRDVGRIEGSGLAHLVMSALAPPASITTEGTRQGLLAMCEAALPRWARVHDFLLRVLLGRPARKSAAHLEGRKEWLSFLNALPQTGVLAAALKNVLLERVLWADARATELGRLYRSAYVLNFLFAAFAVFVGLLSVLDVWNGLFGGIAAAKTVCAAAELVLLLVILMIAVVGRRARWHERFLEARALAEVLRHARTLAPIGRAGRILSARAQVQQFDGGWTHWYARAALRELPTPNARAGADFLRETITTVLTHEVAGQIDYHRANYKSLEAAHRRLDSAGEGLFCTGVFLCLLWLVVVTIYGFAGAEESHWISHTVKSVLTFLGAVLPAFAGAFAGIRAQADFRAAAHQSLTAELELERLLARTKTTMPQTYSAAFALLESIADSMSSELGRWRLIFRHRPISMPG